MLDSMISSYPDHLQTLLGSDVEIIWMWAPPRHRRHQWRPTHCAPRHSDDEARKGVNRGTIAWAEWRRDRSARRCDWLRHRPALPSNERVGAGAGDHEADQQPTGVTDQIANVLPLAAEQVAKRAIAQQPGQLSSHVIGHKAPDRIVAAPCDEVDRDRNRRQHTARQIDGNCRMPGEAGLCAPPRRRLAIPALDRAS